MSCRCFLVFFVSNVLTYTKIYVHEYTFTYMHAWRSRCMLIYSSRSSRSCSKSTSSFIWRVIHTYIYTYLHTARWSSCFPYRCCQHQPFRFLCTWSLFVFYFLKFADCWCHFRAVTVVSLGDRDDWVQVCSQEKILSGERRLLGSGDTYTLSSHVQVR